MLTEAEKDAEAIVWDGRNNDNPFIRPHLSIVVVDALSPGHETQYYPGEGNLRAAGIIVISKVSGATPEGLALIRRDAPNLITLPR